MVSPSKHQVLLHALADDLNLLRRKVSQGRDDEMTVVSAEVVEEHRDLVLLPSLQIASRVCSSAVLAGEVVMVSDFVRSLQERLPTDGALHCIPIQKQK